MRTPLLYLAVAAIAAPPLSGCHFIRADVGQASIHDSDRTGVAAGIRAGRRLDEKGYGRLDFGLEYSAADDFFLTFGAGLEVQPIPTGPLTPFAGVGLRVLGEEDWSGVYIPLQLGVDVAVAHALRLRGGYQYATHGGAYGPRIIFAGIEFRFD